MIKRIIKIVFGVFFVILALSIIVMIGIPTSIIDDSIDHAIVTQCEKVVEIINRNQNRIDSSLIKNAVGNGKCIRKSIRRDEDWDILFQNIPSEDRSYLQKFTNSNVCKYVEVSESNDCVMFLFYSSFHKSFIVGSYQQLYLIYHVNPTCNCKDNPIGDPYRPIASELVKTNWYKVTVKISKRYLHA